MINVEQKKEGVSFIENETLSLQQALLSNDLGQEQIVNVNESMLTNEQPGEIGAQQYGALTGVGKSNTVKIIESAEYLGTEMDQQQAESVRRYEKSIHLRDIVMSFGVFLVFEAVVFLIQGELPGLHFNKCNWKIYVGLVALLALGVAYLTFVRIRLQTQFLEYRRLGIEQEVCLDKPEIFRYIVFAGLSAGLVQGMLGLGAGTCMMAFLLSTGITTTAATATSGYQILFIGLASLVEGFIQGQVQLLDTVFFITLATVLGGSVTLAITHLLKGLKQQRVSIILMVVICSLCCLSIVMVIPTAILSYQNYGWHGLLKIKFAC